MVRNITNVDRTDERTSILQKFILHIPPASGRRPCRIGMMAMHMVDSRSVLLRVDGILSGYLASGGRHCFGQMAMHLVDSLGLASSRWYSIGQNTLLREDGIPSGRWPASHRVDDLESGRWSCNGSMALQRVDGLTSVIIFRQAVAMLKNQRTKFLYFLSLKVNLFHEKCNLGI